MIEKEVLKATLDYLNTKQGVIYIVMPNESQKKRQYTGFSLGVPDLLIGYKGEILFVELKTETGTLKPAQKAWRAKLLEAEFYHEVTYGLDDTIKKIERWLYIINNIAGMTNEYS